MGRIPNLQLDQHNYPEVLFRVHFPNTSHTIYDKEGFRCGAKGRIDICDYDELADELQIHLDWSSGQPSHFVSMFGDKKHAFAWARKILEKSEATQAFVTAIDPIQIKNGYGNLIPILRVSDVIQRYPSLLPYGIQPGWFDDEFLALYKVPARAIFASYPVYLS